MSVIGSRDALTNAIAVNDKVLLSRLVLPPPITLGKVPCNYYLFLHMLLSSVFYPPLRSGDTRGDALYIPHIPSEACTSILSVDVEEA
jgi:hypothetical protein